MGYMPCRTCQARQKQMSKPGNTIELTTGDIKESRKQFEADILQRQRGDTPSLEYIKKYGTKGFTKEELKEARNVWTENKAYVDKTERYKDK